MEPKAAEERFRQVSRIFPQRLQYALIALEAEIRTGVQEIRLRAQQPIQLCVAGKSVFFDVRGRRYEFPGRDCMAAEVDELQEVFRAACGYSVHSHQNEIAQGFLTMEGGHRIGVCGTAVTAQDGVTGIRDITSLNIRIAKEIPGCASEIARCTDHAGAGVLLAGPPGSGKTTLLRDLARQLSSGLCGPVRKVALVDERGELAASWQGVLQNDVGFCTDVLCGFDKAQGIRMAIRTLSPEIIICDEIGTPEDIAALEAGAGCGVKLVASVHAGSARELLQKPFVERLAALGAFRRAVLLENGARVGQIKQILDLGDGHENNGARAVSGLLRAGRTDGGAQAQPKNGTA